MFRGGVNLVAGTHNVTLREREDGARLRRLRITTGYPSCQFATFNPHWNITTPHVYDRILALETESNNRITAVEDAVGSLTDTQIAGLLTTVGLR